MLQRKKVLHSDVRCSSQFKFERGGGTVREKDLEKARGYT